MHYPLSPEQFTDEKTDKKQKRMDFFATLSHFPTIFAKRGQQLYAT